MRESNAAGAGGAAGGRRFLEGSFRGMEFAETGLRFATAIQVARVAMADLKMFAAAARGDMEGLAAAADTLPFGLGDFTKQARELYSGFVQWTSKTLLGRDVFKSFFEDPAAEKRHADEMKRSVEQLNNYLRALGHARAEYARTAFGPKLGRLEELRQEVDEGKLSLTQAREILHIELQTANVKERDALAEKARQAQQEAAGRRARQREREEEAAVARRTKIGEDIASALDRVRAETRRAAGDTATLDEEEAVRHLKEEAAAAGVPTEELQKRLAKVRGAFAQLREARKGATLREAGTALTESLRTPLETAKAEIESAKKLLEAGAIGGETYRRAIQNALEGAAGTLPGVLRAFTARGTSWGLEAAMGMGGSSAADGARAAQETAEHTEKIALILQKLRDDGVPLVWNS
jgi:hypothetical protein